MKISIIALTFIYATLHLSLTPTYGSDSEESVVRVYKLNKKGQLSRKKWVKTVSPGKCFNARKIQEVHRFAQLGYEFCEIFREKNCSADQRVTAIWQGRHYRVGGKEIDTSKPQIQFGRGTKWVLHPTENVKVGSLICY